MSVTSEFYGPCESCRAALRAKYVAERSDVDGVIEISESGLKVCIDFVGVVAGHRANIDVEIDGIRDDVRLHDVVGGNDVWAHRRMTTAP